MKLIDYCKYLVVEGRGDKDRIANLIADSVDGVHEGEQQLAWSLLKEAGIPMYSRQAFLQAAALAIELVDGDEPPRAA
jgi:hypothetical protein